MRQTPTAIAGLMLLTLLAACEDDGQRTPVAPSFDLTTAHTLSGSVLGPAGSMCNSLPAGTPLIVRAFRPGGFSFSGSAFRICPDNTYSFLLDPGTYLVRVQLPSDPSVIESFPWRTITTDPGTIDVGDVTRDVTIPPGTALGGHFTFDGAPVEGAALTLVYDQAPAFGAAVGSTGPDGAWMDFFGRSPMFLQANVRYQAFAGCLGSFGPVFLGSQQISGPPSGGFLFPADVSAIDCTLKTAPTVAFSHDRTRLVVTPMPGDIGGLSPELFDQFGAGWGVQFLSPGDRPHHASVTFSELFEGGLIVGIRPDRVLTGVNLDGYADCGPSCRDLGLDGKMSFASSPQFGKKVIWRYSDAPSPEGVGLKVLQKSFDGIPPTSYVLFRFTFTKSRPAPVTFYAGVFMDWDVGHVDFDAFDDVGFTDRGGRLMYMTNFDGSGPLDGTLVFGATVAGNAVLTDFGQSTATLVAATAGDFTIPTADFPTDHRYIHTVGPITLRQDQSADVWVAVLSGQDPTEFFTNVDAATADVIRRMSDGSDNGGGGAAVLTVSPERHSVLGQVNPRCKRGCKPQ